MQEGGPRELQGCQPHPSAWGNHGASPRGCDAVSRLRKDKKVTGAASTSLQRASRAWLTWLPSRRCERGDNHECSLAQYYHSHQGKPHQIPTAKPRRRGLGGWLRRRVDLRGFLTDWRDWPSGTSPSPAKANLKSSTWNGVSPRHGRGWGFTPGVAAEKCLRRWWTTRWHESTAWLYSNAS